MNPFVADPDWGMWIILYFYLGGLAAGAYFVATLVTLFGHDEDAAIARAGYRLALPLIGVCGLLLIVDLERPERFWHMLLQSEVVDQALEEGWPLGGWGTIVYAPQLKWWSPMSIGAWALAVFGLVSSLSFLGSLWPTGRLNRRLVRGPLARVFLLVGSGVGFFVASYTGVLLTASNQPVWAVTDWIGPLFLTSAGSTGIAALLLLTARSPAVGAASRARLGRADVWALGLELVVFLVFLASLGPALPLTLTVPAGLVLVLGTLLVGLLAPLWGHLGAGHPGPARTAAAAGCALVGGFTLRYGIVEVAPQLLARWHDAGEVPAPGPPGESAVALGLIVITGALAVAMPWLLRKSGHLSPPQTGLAFVVSILVITTVALYALTPDVARSTFAVVSVPAVSPEDGRLRGGGPGASASNRPEPPHLRSKINGVLPDDAPR